MIRKTIGKLLPAHIGGPGTLLPRFVESFLSWALAISCLSVALWHYLVDRYKTRIALAYGKQPKQEPVHKTTQRLLLPLTTHSRREWTSVSDYEGLRKRYLQLTQLISNATILINHPTKEPTDEKKDDGVGTLIGENEYVIVDGANMPEVDSLGHEEGASSVGNAVAKWLSQTPTKSSSSDDDHVLCSESQESLIGLVRSNDAIRRLASLLLGEDPVDGDATPATSEFDKSVHEMETKRISKSENKAILLDCLSSKEPGAEAVIYSLRKIWPKLLQLPAHQSVCNNDKQKVAISIIVPVFREDGATLAKKLEASLKHAVEPYRIEIVVVHVVENDENQNIDKSSSNSISPFETALRESFQHSEKDKMDGTTFSTSPELRILKYYGGGGRGPCLNYGAKHARGSILTFLHADTRLATQGWDKAISDTLDENKNGGPRMTCCAFSFAIDTSPEALTVRQEKKSKTGVVAHKTQYYPPGLHAIEVTANLRCKFFALPYGDQCLSLPTDVFHYVGGYPDQCLMEDYELIRLLRMRSAANLDRSTMGKSFDRPREAIKILFDYRAFCSPRRWQHYGVLLVTYTNSYCVKLYNSGKLTPDDLFCRYYKTATPPNRMAGDKSPWEIGLKL